MSESKQVIAAKVERLKKQVATAEATLAGLRDKLAKAEAQQTGAPTPQTGLDLLWKAAMAIARNRSSKFKCREQWNRIPKGDRPTIETAVAALKIWNRCIEWKRDGNQFVPALDRWIKERRWEDLPDVEAAPSRYPRAAKAAAQQAPEDAATPAEIAEILAALKPRRMNS